MFGNPRDLQPHEIKNLIEKHGKASMGGKVFKLLYPPPTDPKLLAIINDPKFTSKIVGFPTTNGECTYEVKGDAKSLKIKIHYSTYL
jgi:hypothetical protein